MQHIFASKALRLEVLFATLVLTLSGSARAQETSVEPLPPSPTSSDASDAESLHPATEVEASIDLSGGYVGSRFGIGRAFGDHVVLMGAAGFRVSLDDRPDIPEHYDISGRLSLKVYARAPRAHSVSPTFMTSFIYGTSFFGRNAGYSPSRTHDIGGQLHAGATYFATPSLGFQVRTGIGVARAFGDGVLRYQWSLASTTELGITLRY